MGRKKLYASDAERKAAKRAEINGQPGEINGQTESADGINGQNKRTSRPDEINGHAAGFVRFVHQAHVPLALFAGHGRGTVRRHTDGRDYVMVSRHAGSDLGEVGIVNEIDWIVRLAQSCTHGHRGWSCHTC